MYPCPVSSTYLVGGPLIRTAWDYSSLPPLRVVLEVGSIDRQRRIMSTSSGHPVAGPAATEPRYYCSIFRGETYHPCIKRYAVVFITGGSRGPSCSHSWHPACFFLPPDRSSSRRRGRGGLLARPRVPRSPERLCDHLVELTDMAESKGPKEGAERRGWHHPVREHGSCSFGTEHLDIVDVACSRHDRVHEAQHLATGQCTAHAAGQAQRRSTLRGRNARPVSRRAASRRWRRGSARRMATSVRSKIARYLSH
jgi:hypothetical protein